MQLTTETTLNVGMLQWSLILMWNADDKNCVKLTDKLERYKTILSPFSLSVDEILIFSLEKKLCRRV